MKCVFTSYTMAPEAYKEVGNCRINGNHRKYKMKISSGFRHHNLENEDLTFQSRQYTLSSK